MWGFHLPIHDKRKVTPQIFDLGLVLCRCPQQAYGGGWDAAALTAARGSSVDYGILCHGDGVHFVASARPRRAPSRARYRMALTQARKHGHGADALGRVHHHSGRLPMLRSSAYGGLAPYRDCTGKLHRPMGGSLTRTEKALIVNL